MSPLARCIAKHPDWTDRRISKSVAVTLANVRTFRSSVKHPAKAPHTVRARGLSEFRGLYDKSYIIPKKIRDGLAKLGRGGWETELNFARMAGVAMPDIGNYREQFMEYVVSVDRGGRRVWAGSKELAKRLREMTDA